MKIRGFRIELGEVEGRLRDHAAVRGPWGSRGRRGPGDRRLVAYGVEEEGVELEVLHAHLGERLPEHIVPAAYVHLERLSLTPSGRFDRETLSISRG
ncbi:MAG TPA: hypothetical protein VFS20_26395 [Longimicrobium sp.]|nr:hypothetical protein [Longimicrobium sp.]